MHDPGNGLGDLGEMRRRRLAAARLYLVCDATPGGRDLAEVLPAAIAGGVDVVQLRDKRLGEAELLAAAAHARRLCEEHGALFLVNDHPRVAARVHADGVHVGQRDMPVSEVRHLLGPEALVGLSTHTPAEVDLAAGLVGGATIDYAGVGPVHATPTKPGRRPVGIELVRHAANRPEWPFFAIGGIDAINAPAVVAAGARRLAVVRAIAEAADPGHAARVLREALQTRPGTAPVGRRPARTAA